MIESTRPSGTSGRGISLPVSIALHVLVLGAAIGASFWSAEEEPEAQIPVIFHESRFLPDPPGGGSKTSSAPLRTVKPAAATSQSVAILKTASTIPRVEDVESPPTSGDQKETPGIIGGADDDGLGGHRGGGKGQIGTGAGDQDILRPGGDVRAPVLIARVEPAYPEIERKLRKEGVVILEAIITADGAVDEVRVLKSADSFLDEAAKQAVMQWRYRPATLNGRAVSVYLTVTVSFRLH